MTKKSKKSDKEFKLKFAMDNAAFDPEVVDVAESIRNILKEVSETVCRGDKQGSIRDANGNTIGKWGYGE